jgi:hypothetical protein
MIDLLALSALCLMTAAVITFQVGSVFVSCLQDILTPLGFLRVLRHAMCLVPGGLVTAGLVCSSWCFLNRGTSKRSAVNPCGNERLADISSMRVVCVA